MNCGYRIAGDAPTAMDDDTRPGGGMLSRVPAPWEDGRQSSSSGGIRKSDEEEDAKLAKGANLRFTADQIVGLPMNEFNAMLSKEELSEEQINLCRDMRRRGRDEVAADFCRRKKMGE